MNMNEALVGAAEAFRLWFIKNALPLWSTTAIDPTFGMSYERLFGSGEPDYHANIRLRVQARQIFVFSLASELGWMPNAESLVQGLASFLGSAGRHPQGGFVHLLNAKHEVVDNKRDLYDHAFYLLACAWRYRVFRHADALDDAHAIRHLLTSDFQSQYGGWQEGDYPAPYRRQNPHMHLLEAFLALYETTGDTRWLAHAHSIYGLFKDVFFTAEQAALLEYFNGDWSRVESQQGQLIEPGHMLEWVWLLRKYSLHSGENVDTYANALFSTALQYGLSQQGLVYDELRLDGSVSKASKRCWPMTELLKACIAQARFGGNLAVREYEEIALKSLQNLQNHYLNASQAGSYIDQLDEYDNVVAEYAPASTLYHLVISAAEICAYVGLAKNDT